MVGLTENRAQSRHSQHSVCTVHSPCVHISEGTKMSLLLLVMVIPSHLFTNLYFCSVVCDALQMGRKEVALCCVMEFCCDSRTCCYSGQIHKYMHRHWNMSNGMGR